MENLPSRQRVERDPDPPQDQDRAANRHFPRLLALVCEVIRMFSSTSPFGVRSDIVIFLDLPVFVAG